MSDLQNEFIEAAAVDLAARLRADPFFDDIAVIEEVSGDLEKNLLRALGTASAGGTGTVGAAVSVELPSVRPDRNAQDAPGPALEMIFGVGVLVNRTAAFSSFGAGKSAEKIALTIANIIHHYSAAGLGGQCGPFIFDGMLPFKRPEGNDTAYRLTFRASATVGRSSKVREPAIAPGETVVAISCATAGAAIYYSIDGTYPTTLYEAPFALPASGSVIRASGVKTGFIASNTSAVQV